MYDYIDANGKPIKAGDRIRLVGDFPASTDFSIDGKVISISDPDGDVDDYGRSIGIPPAIEILFDDGDSDTFTMDWKAMGPWDEDAPFQTDEMRVING